MLDDAANPATAQHAAHFPEEALPVVGRHVVEYTTGEDQIEGAIVIGQLSACADAVGDAGVVLARAEDRFCREVATMRAPMVALG